MSFRIILIYKYKKKARKIVENRNKKTRIEKNNILFVF